MTATFEPGAPATAAAQWTTRFADELAGRHVDAALVAPLLDAVDPDWSASGAAQLRRLVDLGWADEQGTASAWLRQIVEDLACDGADVYLGRAGPEGLRGARLRVGATRALLAVEVEPRGWDTDRGLDGHDLCGELSVRVIALGEVPMYLARWGGVGPVWTEGDPLEIGRGTLRRRLQGIAADAPAGLDDLWSRDWSRWSIACEATDTELTYVAVDGVGQFSVALPDGGTVVLTPRPAGLLWGDLQQAYIRLPSVRRALGEAGDDEDW